MHQIAKKFYSILIEGA